MIAALSLGLLLLGGPHGNPQGIRWEKNFDEALRKARQTGKPIMIDFWASWCGWCHRLDQTTYVDPTVTKLAEEFVTVKVNTEGGPKDQAVARRYGVSSLPTVAFASPSGRLVLRLPGFQGPGAFPRTLEAARAAAGHVIGWEEAIDRDGRDAAALASLGAYMFEQESYDDSRELLEKALRHDGDRPSTERKRTRMLLGIIRKYENKLAEAEVLLKEGLTIRPSSEYDPKILYILGKTYLSWGRQGDCRTVMQKIVSEHPGSSVAPRAREVLSQLGRR